MQKTPRWPWRPTAAVIQLANSPAPYIVRLVHKGSGTAVVTNPADKNLFVVGLKKDGKREYVKNFSAKQSSAIVEKVDGDTKAVLKFSRFGGTDLSVDVYGVCRIRTGWCGGRFGCIASRMAGSWQYDFRSSMPCP